PPPPSLSSLLFYTHPSPTTLYTLSLHDALPISPSCPIRNGRCSSASDGPRRRTPGPGRPTASGRRRVAATVMASRLGNRETRRRVPRLVEVEYLDIEIILTGGCHNARGSGITAAASDAGDGVPGARGAEGVR